MIAASTTDGDLPWLDERWRASVLEWVSEALSHNGRAVVGEVEQPHVYPWSTVLRIPTDDGAVWFKGMGRGTAYEGPLLVALAKWCPDRVLVPLAVDLERRWLLLPDGGTTLRTAEGGKTDLAHWERVLVEYAELQRRVAGRADEMVAAGVPDLRPDALPGALAELLADESALMVGRPEGMSSEQLTELRSAHGRFTQWSEELAATGVPSSLQHDDLHDANVFVPYDGVGPYRVFDWGDSSVAHPFTTLLVSLRVVAHNFKLPNGAPELLRLRDAYLEPWRAEHDRATLVEACRLAVKTGPLGRALSYRRAVLDAKGERWTEWAEGVPGWLLELGQPTPLEPEPAPA